MPLSLIRSPKNFNLVFPNSHLSGLSVTPACRLDLLEYGCESFVMFGLIFPKDQHIIHLADNPTEDVVMVVRSRDDCEGDLPKPTAPVICASVSSILGRGFTSLWTRC